MELAPAGWMLGIKSDERFEKLYVAQLERLGVERISDLLQAISDEEGGKDLALLCYEDVHAREVCHRRMFARWWTEQTGQEVPELQQYCDQSHNRQKPLQDTLW
jgi:rubrerythrin